jgi:hypothetical protein
MIDIHQALDAYFYFDKWVNPLYNKEENKRTKKPADPSSKKLVSEKYQIEINCKFFFLNESGQLEICAYSMFEDFKVLADSKAKFPLMRIPNTAWGYWGMFLNAAAYVAQDQLGLQDKDIHKLKIVDMVNDNYIHKINYIPFWGKTLLDHQLINPMVKKTKGVVDSTNKIKPIQTGLNI